jgi:ferritin-like metal-binding protein YciE
MYHQSLEERFLDQLQDLYDSEQAVVKELPKLVQSASTPELRRVFEYCLKQTEENIHHTAQILSSAGLCLDLEMEPTSTRPVKLRLVSWDSQR